MAAAAAAAAYVTANQGMSDYLRTTLEVDSPRLRLNLMKGGFRLPTRLAAKDDKFIYQLCNNIRKGDGNSVTRNIGAELQENLQKFQTWCMYRNIIQRDFDYDQATLANLSDTAAWKTQLPPDPTDTQVGPFEDRGDRRVWFEAIRNYLGQKKGASGMPILYGIRPEAAVPTPADDPGFGLPGFDDELYFRGRHNGTFWRADNAMIWQLLWKVCHGTTAWNTISSFETAKNGRGAMLALLRQYMGSDVQGILIRHAETFLENARFDGRHKNYDWHMFVNKIRQAFSDLGPEDQMSNSRKVIKLVRAFQVPGLEHLDAMITGDPIRRNDFEATVVFLSDQMASLKTKNTGNHARTLAAMDMDPSDTERKPTERKPRFKPKSKPHKKTFQSKHKKMFGTTTKTYTKEQLEDPALQYYPNHEWKPFSPEKKASYREARRAAGIPTGIRNVSSCHTTNMAHAWDSDDSTDSETGLSTSSEEEDSEDEDDLLPIPAGRALNMTQRSVGDAKNDRKRKQRQNKVKLLKRQLAKAEKKAKHT
jgi:hypothetical protein